MLLLRFLNRQSFLTNQLTKHSSRQSGDYLPGLILVVNTLLWSKPVFINLVRPSTTSCQYMTNYNPAIINPVQFDYKSPVLYMDSPVSIITRYGFIINRHNMEGVINTQDWGYHLYYKKLVKPTM